MNNLNENIEIAKMRAIHELLELATFRHEDSILPMLQRIDHAYADVEKIINQHGNRDIFASFAASRNEVRHFIKRIEKRKSSDSP